MNHLHPPFLKPFAKYSYITGFTLAELLIALVILGVIATFAIPKVLTSQNDAKRIAIFKESIAALNEAFYGGWMKGEVNDANFGTYMLDHLNAVKLCNTNAVTQGCWPPASDPVAGQASQKGLILHNGAMVTGLDDSDGGTGRDTLLIDWNGLDEPNVEGDDELVLHAIFTPTGGNRVGAIRENNGFPASVTLWAEIFSN
ncbi:MAG: type II secretion system protein [Vampirovibrionales bacterium]|nr:type II secretion system protein [Vampirovibrionales bacterium]